MFVSPARISGEHRKRHPLSELLCDAVCQGGPEGNSWTAFDQTLLKSQRKAEINLSLKAYRGRMVPGPGSSGPGTNTKRLLQVQDENIQVKQ